MSLSVSQAEGKQGKTHEMKKNESTEKIRYGHKFSAKILQISVSRKCKITINSEKIYIRIFKQCRYEIVSKQIKQNTFTK